MRILQPEDREAAQDGLQDSMQRFLAPPGEEGALLTGWIVLAEFMAADGQRWVGELVSPATTTWQAKGMCWEYVAGSLGQLENE